MTAATAPGTETSSSPDVVVGIDTHKHTHMAVALGANGGWLGSLQLDAKRSGCRELIRWAAAFGSSPVFAVEGTGCCGAGLCRALAGTALEQLCFDAVLLRGNYQDWPAPAAAGINQALRELLTLEQRGLEALRSLVAAAGPPALPQAAGLPSTNLGRQLGVALRLVGGSQPPPVIALAHGGYDTHPNQAPRQVFLLGQLAEALAGFERGLASLGSHRPEVELITISEFGRRLQVNGSGGTDHGSASLLLRLGDRVGDRLQGTYPSLSRTDARADLITSWTLAW
jgi:uncharacterized protein (DUF1501 family)